MVSYEGTTMNQEIRILLFLILVLILAACPVQAFTAKTLDIEILDSGDGLITFDYELSWYENLAVFSRMADPGLEFAKAAKSQYKKDVDVLSVSEKQARFRVSSLATRKESNGEVSLVTPALSFKGAQKALQNYWFAPLIQVDFSPEISRVRFPDGYTEEFYNQDQIPSIDHNTGMPA
jgi:hypothetical protein